MYSPFFSSACKWGLHAHVICLNCVRACFVCVLLAWHQPKLLPFLIQSLHGRAHVMLRCACCGHVHLHAPMRCVSVCVLCGCMCVCVCVCPCVCANECLCMPCITPMCGFTTSQSLPARSCMRPWMQGRRSVDEARHVQEFGHSGYVILERSICS